MGTPAGSTESRISAVVEGLPTELTLEATTACNLRCPLCPTHETPRGYRYLTPVQVKAILESTAAPIKRVGFHMLGEPLMNKQLFALVRICADRGIKTYFSTNGMLVDRYVEDIFSSGLNVISFALDGIHSEDYARYRIGGDLDTVIANIRMLIAEKKKRRARRPRIDVKCVMFSYNEDKEAEIVSFLERLGADSFTLKRPNYQRFDELGEKPNDFLDLVDHTNKERKYARSLDPSLLYRNQPICPNLTRAWVHSDGSLVACCGDPMGETTFGNVDDKPFEEIWRSDAHRDVVRRFIEGKIEVCKECELGSDLAVTESGAGSSVLGRLLRKLSRRR